MSSRPTICRWLGAFRVIENTFCWASCECFFVLSVFCKYKTNFADILFFLNLVLNIYENPRREIHSWIDGIVKVEYFHVFWFYGVINLNSRYRVQLFAFLSANKVVKYLLHFTLSGAVITENGHSMNYVGGH